MKVTPLSLPGALLIEPDVYTDPRGAFLETFQAAKYAAHGIAKPFIQDNHSRSMRHTLRGLHAQIVHPQAKLIRVVSGEIFDVVVDIRWDSPTFGQWNAVRLSGQNYLQCYVPEGFAHGFCVLSDWADVEYKVTDYYDPAGEITIRWDDPDLAIDWPEQHPLLSKKDTQGITLRDFKKRLSPSIPQK